MYFRLVLAPFFRWSISFCSHTVYMMSLRIKLRSSVRDKGQQIEQITSENAQKPKSRRALYIGTYRKKMKESRPEQWQQFKADEAARVRHYRQNMSEEKRKASNENAKLRVRALRKRKEIAPDERVTRHNNQPLTRTRSESDKKALKRERWRIMKQAQRSRMSKQKKRRIREKDAAQKRKKRAEIINKPTIKYNSVHATPTGNTCFSSASAKRQATKRARQAIPHSVKGAEVILSLIKSASPQKREQLEKMGVTLTTTSLEPMQDLLTSVRKTISNLHRKKKRYFANQLSAHLDKQHGLTKTSHRLGFTPKFMRRYSSLKMSALKAEGKASRSDALIAETQHSVNEFYRRLDVSTEMPTKKGLGPNANEPKRVLNRTVDEVHKSFLEENPDLKIGRAKFSSLRPKCVCLQNKAKLQQCLCEYCTNIDLKLKAINQEVVKHKTNTIKNRYHLCDLTLCPKDGPYAPLKCIDRLCPNCGVKGIQKFLGSLLEKSAEKPVSWNFWGHKIVGDGKKRVALLRSDGSLSELIEEVMNDLETYAAHLFHAKWQQMQFYKVMKQPPESSAVMVMDFAENFLCLNQNEVQSAHWFQVQVTIHPMVCSYRCTDCSAEDPVREAVIIISEDMTHDSNAVFYFTRVVVHHLQQVRQLKIARFIQFSDGCGAQYKSRTPFVDLSHASEDLDIKQVERHFFGSRHGKNPCDGEGGIIKNAASRAIKSDSNVHINSAESMYNFCKGKLSKGSFTESGECNHSRRSFYLIKKGEIERNRPKRTGAATLPGTRKLHAIVGLAPMNLNVRRLSCFCDSCTKDESSSTCANSEYVTNWKHKQLKYVAMSDDVETAVSKRKVTNNLDNTHGKFTNPVLILICDESLITKHKKNYNDQENA